jgi:hypothetical protein
MWNGRLPEDVECLVIDQLARTGDPRDLSRYSRTHRVAHRNSRTRRDQQSSENIAGRIDSIKSAKEPWADFVDLLNQADKIRTQEYHKNAWNTIWQSVHPTIFRLLEKYARDLSEAQKDAEQGEYRDMRLSYNQMLKEVAESVRANTTAIGWRITFWEVGLHHLPVVKALLNDLKGRMEEFMKFKAEAEKPAKKVHESYKTSPQTAGQSNINHSGSIRR